MFCYRVLAPLILGQNTYRIQYTGIEVLNPILFAGTCKQSEKSPEWKRLAEPPFSPGDPNTGGLSVTGVIFEKYHKQYMDYKTSQEQTAECVFDCAELKLKYLTTMYGVCDQLRERLEKTKACLAHQLESLEQELNRNFTDDGRRMHRVTRVLRNIEEKVTLADLNSAFVILESKGEQAAAKFLFGKNPNLHNRGLIMNALNTGIDMLLVKREVQRLERAVGPNGELTILVENLNKPDITECQGGIRKQVFEATSALTEEIQYDPFENPTWLVIETEIKIGLWPSQVPAIRKLAPSSDDRKACLFELAMGAGKTYIISPLVINLLADGETLPILVMPESLVPSVAQQLQESMEKGTSREIRVIPIDRIDHNANDIDNLRHELEYMVKAEVPLIWSSNDIQTLINSWIEDMEKARCLRCAESSVGSNNPCNIGNWQLEKCHSSHTGLTAMEAERQGLAWAKLFSFLREKAEIVADEIHVILDILTSYNFAIGDAQPIEPDELDAVCGFVTLVVNHRDIVYPGAKYGTKLPFLQKHVWEGWAQQEMTMQRWNEIKQVLVDTLVDDHGITNDNDGKAYLTNSKTGFRSVAMSSLFEVYPPLKKA